MKTIRKMRMVRPADALLPAAYMIAAALGKSKVAGCLYLCQFASLLLGLTAARGLRQAFSLQPSLRRVRGSVLTALLIQVCGGLIQCLFLCLRPGFIPFVPIAFGFAGLLLNTEHVFYEYLYATGDGSSASLCRFITSALMLSGMLMTAEEALSGLSWAVAYWPMVMAALSTAVSGVIGWNIGSPLKGKLNDQVLKCAPLSILQSALYPAVWLLLWLIPVSPLRAAQTPMPFFAGLIVYELCRAPFRRGAAEAFAMNRTLLIVSAVALTLAVLLSLPPVVAMLTPSLGPLCEEIRCACLSVVVACACGFGMFGNVRRRNSE